MVPSSSAIDPGSVQQLIAAKVQENLQGDFLSPEGGKGQKGGLPKISLKNGLVGDITPGLILTPVFVMKIVEIKFMDGKFGIKMLAFRKKPNCYLKPNGEYYTENMSYKGSSGL